MTKVTGVLDFVNKERGEKWQMEYDVKGMFTKGSKPIDKENSLKCPICKQTESHKTLALDNATNITGYAIIQDGKLLDYGLIKSKGNKLF